MNRRNFLKYGLSVGAAAAVAGGVGLARSGASSAQGPMLPQILERLTVRGRRLEILQRADVVSLRLDGRELRQHVFFRAGRRGELYESHMLPFSEYTRPAQLARELIDNDKLLYVL